MKAAFLIKDNCISHYPADLLIDNKIVKSYNLLFELKNFNVKVLIGKSLPSELIKELRDNGILFLKANDFDEVDGLDFEFNINKEKIKRGAGCQSKFTRRQL
jgi:hypothetical protein